MNPWVLRIGVAAVVLGGGLVAHTFLRFATWRRGMTAGLSEDSQVAHTSRGPIEYVTLGAGVPVLWLHGNPGGYDQLSRAFLVRPGFNDGLRSIVVSRPGYLRTPLSSGATPEEQAHLFAALLDSLHVERVAIVGVSGGGPAALQFARLYPARTQSLALVFAITRLGPPEPIGRLGRLVAALGADDVLVWRAARASARASSRMKDPVLSDSAYQRSASALAASVLPRDARRAGDENDRYQFERSAGWPVDGISAPTLVLAGTRDLSVPFEHAQFAMDRIPGARLVRIEGGHEASLTRAHEVWPAVRAFILEHSAR